MNVARIIIGMSMGVMLFTGQALAIEPAEVEKFVKARIDIGEMMTNYFKDGGMSFGEGQRPSPEQMREMRDDINSKLNTVLSKYDLTIDEYRKRSPEVFADDAAVKGYLNEHPDLKQRYDALPMDRMGVGLEYLYGFRRNKDGQNGDNSRIQMAFQYRF